MLAARVNWLPLRRALPWLAPIAAGALLVAHRSTMDAGADALRHADWGWLVAAMIAMSATWFAAACSQVGATTTVIPLPRVLAVQVAASFVNHVLPAGAGSVAVNLRMLRRLGLGAGSARVAVAINTGAGIVIHVAALAVLLPLAPLPISRWWLLGTAAALSAATVIVVGGVVVMHRYAPARRLGLRLVAAVRAGAGVLRDPRRLALLLVGSAAIPALHIAVLLAVANSLHIAAPALSIAIAYLGASAVAALVPSPGAFGSLDIALVAALVAVGSSLPAAVAVVVAYRLLTVWLPLLPAAATTVILLRRRVV